MLRLFAGVMLLAVWIVPGLQASAQSSSGGERLERMTVLAEVQPNGDLIVSERIVWNFGSNSKRGIFRYIPERFPVDNKLVDVPDPTRSWTRVTTIDWLRVTSPSGAPVDTTISTEGSNSVMRIGNPQIYISGRHTYDISYRVERAVVDGLLQFVAVGEGWTVPVDDVSITVKAPVRAGAEPVCIRGSSGATCQATRTADGVAVRTSGVGIEVEIPVDDTIKWRSPKLETPHTVADGFTATGAPGAVGALALIGAIAGAVATGRKGRDRVFASGGALGQPGDQERPRKLRERIASPVEFEPPEGIRPGLVQPARSGESSQQGISATVVDLAARGVLQIEPIGDDGKDYRLTFTGKQPVKSSQQITANEQNLLDVLFTGTSGSVTLDELSGRTQLASQMATVRGLLLHEAVEHGWWVANPVHVRARWRAAGLVLLAAGVGLTFFLAGASRFGLLGVAVGVFGLGVLAAAQTMPVRTATGSRIEARLRGFELLFDAGEGDRLKLAERQNLFAEYLPYAMAFGNVDKWVKTFEKMGVQPTVPYFGPMGGYGPGFYPMGWGTGGSLQGALDGFDRSLNQSIAAGAAAEAARQAAARSSSSSGGFSGGSFGGGGSSGGGGGGSW